MHRSRPSCACASAAGRARADRWRWNGVGDRAAAGPCPVSPVPRNGRPGRLMTWTSSTLGNRIEAQDRIGLPVGAGMRVRRNSTPRRASSSRLQDAAFDLVASTIRVDRLAAIDRGDARTSCDAAGLAFDLDLQRDRAIGGEVLVFGERKAAAAAGSGFLPSSQILAASARSHRGARDLQDASAGTRPDRRQRAPARP